MESLSAVLKELGARRPTSPPLGQRVIVVDRIHPHIWPRQEGRDGVGGALAELWWREVSGAPEFPALRRRVQTLRGGEVRRVRVPQQRRGRREEVQGPRGGGQSSGKTDRQRPRGRLWQRGSPALASLTPVGHRESRARSAYFELVDMRQCSSKFPQRKFAPSSERARPPPSTQQRARTN